MFLEGKNLLVLGLGKTGLAVIDRMHKVADTIIAVDDNPRADTGNIKEKGAKIVLGNDASNKEALDDADIIITSPGIPASHPLIQYALEINIPIWSELELGWSLLPPQERKRTIAVTGTNGKTTAVNLLGHMLSVNNSKVKVCGNIGDPIINTVDEKGIYRVIEVSSFQLERSNSFAPFIGILLNISSDHIDRHGTIELYTETKFKLFSYQTRSDFSIFNKDDPLITQKASGTTLKSRVVTYGLKQDKGLNLWHDRPYVVYEIGQKQGRISIEKANLGGKHNILNIIACLAAAVILGIEDNIIEKAVGSFKPLKHRLEYLGNCRGINCYNDSKATNPHATIAALDNFSKPLTLILGGKDKGMDLDDLFEAIDKKVSNLILLGESRKKIQDVLDKRKSSFNVHMVKSLKQGVDTGLSVTPSGGILLLSPAFASMDMFKDYKDRGNQFRAIIEERINDHR